jgi:hypothetical protein
MMKILRKIFVAPIKLYRKFISPLLPPSCRFYPSCSAYALEAIERFGIVKGSLLAAFRILRCNPLCKGGIDYVPEEFPFLRKAKK